MNSTPASSGTTVWQSCKRRAALHINALAAEIDLAAPQRGLDRLRLHNAAIDARLLGVELHHSDSAIVDVEQPADVYERQRDLVVVYPEAADRPFSVQVYWSALGAQPPADVVIDAVVSVQTRSWEAYPQVVIRSAFERGEMALADDSQQVAVVRLADSDWSYVEAAFPGDFALQHAPSAGASGCQTAWLFAPVFMERGVIRRLRLRGAFVSRQNDVASALAVRDALAAERPPLTA